MGRHSLDSAPSAPAGPQQHESIAPITDPVLLDAVQRDLRSLRVREQPSDATAALKRVETPFSGPVDVPVENVIGPHRPDGPSAEPAAPRRAEPRAAAVTAAPALSERPATTPRPVAARSASSPRTVTATGPVIVPTHRPVPVPVESPRDLDAAQDVEQQEPIGLSARTLLLSTGIGLLASTALSLLALIPR